MKLIDLKISSEHEPVVDRAPDFSWVIASENENVRQTSYAITVEADGEIVWEKSEDTEQSTFIPYGGPLKSRTRYHVLVKVTDNYGEADSMESAFETALLSREDWSAKWVKNSLPVSAAEKGFGKQPPATMFRRRFSCGQNIVRARLYMTCHGVYRPYLNGARIGNAEFAPEHSVYEKVLFYQTYDVTHLLTAGENDFAAYVGDGWYLGVKTTPRVRNFERRHALLFQIEIEYADGRRECIVSDENTECAYGPVVSSDLFSGERYDANRMFSEWKRAELADYGYNNLCAQMGGGVVCVEEIPAQEVLSAPNGEKILDFGKVLAGRVRMRVRAPKGTVLRLTHTEVLDTDGNFFQNTDMPDGGVEQIDEYISDGTEKTYEPLFTYHGFRYVKIEGIGEIRTVDFTARAYSTHKENAGSFSCSDERLNKLYRNIRNSQSSNMISIPTDCPQREKAGWTGDIAIYARTALLNEAVTPFLRRWLLSVRADQSKDGAIPQIVPYDGGYPMSEVFFGAMFDETDTFGVAGWSDCCVLVPWAVYEITGNTRILRENFAVMERWCDYILKRCAMPRKDVDIPYEYDRWLWNNGFQQGDWLVPSIAKNAVQYEDAMSGSLSFQTNFAYEYSVPMYGWHTFSIMEKIAALLGEEQKRTRYAEIAANMKRAIQHVLFDENGLKTKYMGGYVLAIAFDLVPEHCKEKVKAQLLDSLKLNDGCLDTGFLSTPYLLDAFCMIGRRDLAYALLYQTKCPSWLYEVERGATSVWESWESFEEDGTPKKISFNHYAFGCVDDWIFRNICGITPLDAGFRRFRIQPVPDECLAFARRSFASEYGTIAVSWEKREGEFVLVCEIPCNTQAEIVLPGGKRQWIGSGKYVFREARA